MQDFSGCSWSPVAVPYTCKHLEEQIDLSLESFCPATAVALAKEMKERTSFSSVKVHKCKTLGCFEKLHWNQSHSTSNEMGDKMWLRLQVGYLAITAQLLFSALCSKLALCISAFPQLYQRMDYVSGNSTTGTAYYISVKLVSYI